MAVKSIKDYFTFSRDQRKGLIILFILIISLQLMIFFVDFSAISKQYPEKQKWLSLQSQVDSMKREKHVNPKIHPFNPNFISDYKGYKLGMTVQEIDRLFAFRKRNKYVNTAQEFQDVTLVSDSLLHAIAPLFKFPVWANNKKGFKKYNSYANISYVKKEKVTVTDINLASQEQLMKVYGIGEAISTRIIKLRESLGGFVSMEQMSDVWGLSPEVIEKLNASFKVLKLPNIHKVDINNATLKELSQFSYFKYPIAKQIVTYRSMNGDIKNIEDLTKIKAFPVDKAKIIALYLDF